MKYDAFVSLVSDNILGNILVTITDWPWLKSIDLPEQLDNEFMDSLGVRDALQKYTLSGAFN